VSQSANLQRVTDNIAHHVVVFCRRRLRTVRGIFRASDLVAYVQSRSMFIAPDSPSRILRQLRLAGRVDYIVVNRAASLYRVVAVRP
jgi:ABC-type amino acid transport substrate-binding protein